MSIQLCADFDFASERIIGSKTFFNNTGLENIDGYGAEWIKLGLKDDTVLSCDSIPFVQGNYPGNFVCNP